ncbi:MAG: Protein tyrosine phosphatase [Candidatus Tokpelaia hoelldobleri]|uniref:Protein tyrosine phosphatase n=1 Tax=Candidatus Tokpelaia hoelldobleri TaxID=1902579 RepID=A0A1U9JWC0_9HYPH|nr:MAG: Protein tyrosine phosphatase [Candidatus Tokpelaia hoelldoblerii]
MTQMPFHSDRPSSVLFVCGLNAIRSPIAEALTQKFFPDIYVASAGIFKGEADSFAAAIIAEETMAQANYNPRGLEDLTDGFFDLVITLSPQVHEAVMTQMRDVSVTVEYWPVSDPSQTQGAREQILDAYRIVREDLKNRILARFARHAP